MSALPKDGKDPSQSIGKKHENKTMGLIDLTGSSDESEDEDLKKAIALSLENNTDTVPHDIQQSIHNEANPGLGSSRPNLTTQQVKGLLGFDRKQMELERLARLKRKHGTMEEGSRPISPPPLNQKNSPIASAVIKSAAHADHRGQLAILGKPATNVLPSPSTKAFTTAKVFLTSLDDSSPQSMSLSKLIRPIDTQIPLKSALLSTFIVDFDWLLPHFDTRTVSFVLSLHAQNEEHKKLLQQDFEGIPNVRLVFPYVGGNVNCMHSKIMLLFYESTNKNSPASRCRIVIPSANLTPADWGAGAVMENILFVIDLFPRSQEIMTPELQNTAFKLELLHVLKQMGIADTVMAKLDKYDFSMTSEYRFVHTIGGSHLLPNTSKQSDIAQFIKSKPKPAKQPVNAAYNSTTKIRTGLHCLSDAVRSMGFDISEDDPSYPLRMDYITSSLGYLKHPFLHSLSLAACGSAPLSSPESHVSRTANRRSRKDESEDSIERKPNLLSGDLVVYFPSDLTVHNSKGGPNAAGTICFQSKWWANPKNDFPQDLLRDCIGVRDDGILMHSKVLFTRFKTPKMSNLGIKTHCSPVVNVAINAPKTKSTITDDTVGRLYAGWAYVGSANLSESAWGTLVKDSKTKQPKLNCRNWESGVMIPIPFKEEHQNKNLHDLTLEEVFGDIIPVPIKYPGVSMLDAREPWFFNG